MILDLDKLSISEFSIEDYHPVNGYIEHSCYSFFVKDNKIKILNVRLGNFYSKGELFSGEIIKNGKKVCHENELSPETITPLFKKQTDYWNDGVEVNYQFLCNKILFEFSWSISKTKLIPSYISLEAQ